MKLNKILGISAGLLTGLLGVQMLVLSQQEPRETHYATWDKNPKSLAEGQKLSKRIVKGRVIKIERGKDIVVKTPGEPGGVDRIPVEIVTLALTGRYKGKGTVPKTVRVFHTGVSRVSTKGLKRKPKPKDGKHGGLPIPTKARSKRSASQVNRFVLEDDPPYRMGQKYIMYLRDGPTVRDKAGRRVKTSRMVNPSLRMRVLRGNKLRPATTRMPFARRLRGKPLTALTSKLPRFKSLRFNKQAPQLQRIRLGELKKAKKMGEYNRLLKQLPARMQRQLKR